MLLSMLCVVVVPLLLSAQTAVPGSPTVRQLIEEGNELTDKQFDHRAALQKYLDALAFEPKNYEALWRTSRAYDHIAKHLPASTDEEKHQQLTTYEKALECANRGIAVNPNGTRAFTWRAIANGHIALFRGVWESTDLAKQIKSDLEKAINLDPSNHLAWYVFGRTHAKVSERPKILRWPLGLGWANMEEAVQCYERAIAMRPDFIMYRLDCARAYIDEEEYDKARVHLTAIQTLSTQDEDDDQLRKEAKALLERIKEK